MIYDYIGEFSSELIIVKIGDKYGFINKNNELVVEAIYDNVYGFNNGYAKGIKEHDDEQKIFIIDKTGKVISKIEKDIVNITDYDNDLLMATKIIDEDTKFERLARLNEQNRKCCLASNQKFLGRDMEVLIENFENHKGQNVITGRTRNNKIVHIPYDKDLTGEFVMAKIVGVKTWYLKGELIENK